MMNHVTQAKPLFAALLMLICAATADASINAIEAGLKGDGETDDTPVLQSLLDGGDNVITFSKGTYVLGAVKLPANTHLVFEPEAKILPVRESLAFMEEKEVRGTIRTVESKHALFTVVGDHVRLEGLHFDFCSAGTEKDPTPVERLIYAENVSDVTVDDCHVIASSPKRATRRTRLRMFDALDSTNLVLSNSVASGFRYMIWTMQCGNVSVHGNRMTDGDALTTFAFGSENLRHYDNWSRNVDYQCVWRGGSPDPSRKAPSVPLGSANFVKRGLKKDDPDYVPHTQGVFDVLVQNNYAEYGTALCWGNKGRQTVVDGNIARFMWDYSFGSEGGENLIFSNNISINSTVAGIDSMYWGEKLVVSGNLIIVRHEPFDEELAGRPAPTYFGQFLRLHHGPPNPEDKYGAGSALITGNLFVNELANRPSGIAIEGGRDVMFSGNKVINGLLRKHDELSLVKRGQDVDEFISSQVGPDAPSANDPEMLLLRRVSGDLSRLTISGNEFITRQPGDKPAVLINGSVSTAVIKDNVFRKEETHINFTDEQRELETQRPRFMMYAVDDNTKRSLTNDEPATAIRVAVDTPVMSIIQGNVILGWNEAIQAENGIEDGTTTFIVTGNTTDGNVTATGSGGSTRTVVDGNIQLPEASQ